MTNRERACQYLMSRCAAQPEGAPRVDIGLPDEAGDVPCDCLDALTKLLDEVRNETIADVAELADLRKVQAALNGIDAALKRHVPNLGGGTGDRAGWALAEDVRSMLDTIGFGRETALASEPR